MKIKRKIKIKIRIETKAESPAAAARAAENGVRKQRHLKYQFPKTFIPSFSGADRLSTINRPKSKNFPHCHIQPGKEIGPQLSRF